jgi:hypothetical protein
VSSFRVTPAAWTSAGLRRIRLLPTLRDELLTLNANSGAGSSELVFPTQTGGPLNQSNVRNRLLAKPSSAPTNA